ncbi:MAG: hypothetical protein H0X25_12460 [Acidobacteriales bacterium]|nr:hypothetical protein [Terriglobales bacterium]
MHFREQAQPLSQTSHINEAVIYDERAQIIVNRFRSQNLTVRAAAPVRTRK